MNTGAIVRGEGLVASGQASSVGTARGLPTAPTPASRLQSVSAYGSAPKPPRSIDLKLDANEGPGLPDEVLETALRDAAPATRLYPAIAPLERIIADRFGVSNDRVLVTAGSDDALERVCRCVLEPGCHAIVAVPTFEMIPRYVALASASLIGIEWTSEGFPLEAMLAAITPDTRAIFVVSPNNPTGQVACEQALRTLAERAPNAMIVLDAAYGEFSDHDLTATALTLSNVIVLRTLSKAWGLAGLRVGYAIGQPEHVAWLRRVGQPYAVSRVSIAIATNALTTQESRINAGVARARQERRELAALLRSLGASPIESQGNFVLARVRDGTLVADLLAGLGIAVRTFPYHPSAALLKNMVRITCPCDEVSFERLKAALRAALTPEAMLFDLDGVLADVSRSYRAAIVQTCANFGASVTPHDIAGIKAQGNANNDWVVTHRLLSARGIQVSLSAVTARFEELYQGTPGRPGLRTTETLLISRDRLRSLAARTPLGIVTGRPRSDAKRFLEEHSLTDLFRVVVCMEDAPLKPDPAPISLALTQLGVSRAWMLGDTVDDARSARSAGVVPIACIAPGVERDDSPSVQNTLLSAGAARVLSGPDDIVDLFP